MEIVILKGDGREARAKIRNGVVFLPKGFGLLPRHRPARAKTPAKTKAPAKSLIITVTVLKDASDYSPRAVTQRLVNVLGNNTVAALLGVSKDSPNRWA